MASPFIVGAARSGTTLLRMMLHSHPAMAVAPETHYIPKIANACRLETNPGQTFLELLLSNDHWRKQRVSEESLTHRIKAIQPFDLSEALRSTYVLYAERLGKPRWGEKTPPYVLHMSLIEKLLPEAHFIHIIRDGRDVALSVKDVWFGPNTIEGAAAWWVKRINSAHSQAGILSHYMEVRYEQLILDTESTLRKICDFIALPYDPAMLNYHETAKGGKIHPLLNQPPQPSRIDRWRKEMTASDLKQFESIAGETLRELGYEVNSARGSRKWFR